MNIFDNQLEELNVRTSTLLQYSVFRIFKRNINFTRTRLAGRKGKQLRWLFVCLSSRIKIQWNVVCEVPYIIRFARPHLEILRRSKNGLIFEIDKILRKNIIR